MKILLVALLFCVNVSFCYKAVMLVPGAGPSSQYWAYEIQVMLEHLGTDTVIATYDQGFLSLQAGWTQIHRVYNARPVTKFLARNPDGFHVVAGSLGSVVARGLVQYYGLPVINFISVAGVHMGLEKLPWFLAFLYWMFGFGKYFPNGSKESYEFHNRDFLQNNFIVASLLRDPCDYESYLKHNKFFPTLNNEIKHENSSRFKENFLKIKNLYLFDSPDDGWIWPWQSGHFSFLECNGSITEMKNQSVYTEDLFGLKTLDLRGAVHHEVVEKTSHPSSSLPPFVHRHIIPLLT